MLNTKTLSKVGPSKYGKLREMAYRNIAKAVWFCSACCDLREKKKHSEETETLTGICRFYGEDC